MTLEESIVIQEAIEREFEAEKNRADVAEEALKLVCECLDFKEYGTKVDINSIINHFKQQALQRLKEIK